MDEQRFDVEAKVALSATQVEIGSMLLSLLEERFSLKWSRENEDARGYRLVLGKGPLLLNPATPSQQPATTMREGATRPKISPGQLFPGAQGAHYTHISMPALCDRIGVLLGAPVIDDTGLDGYYDVWLAKPAQANNGEPGEWVFAALEDFGLSLKRAKVATTRIRVVSADRVPTPN